MGKVISRIRAREMAIRCRIQEETAGARSTLLMAIGEERERCAQIALSAPTYKWVPFGPKDANGLRQAKAKEYSLQEMRDWIVENIRFSDPV